MLGRGLEFTCVELLRDEKHIVFGESWSNFWAEHGDGWMQRNDDNRDARRRGIPASKRGKLPGCGSTRVKARRRRPVGNGNGGHAHQSWRLEAVGRAGIAA